MGKSFERMQARVVGPQRDEPKPVPGRQDRRTASPGPCPEPAPTAPPEPFWTETAQTIPFVEVPPETPDTLPMPQVVAAAEEAPPELRVVPADDQVVAPRLQRFDTGPIYPEGLLNRLATLRDPNGDAARQYRQMASQLMEHLPSSAAVLVLVPLERLGRAMDLTAALGVTLAATTQQPILLVDASRNEDGLASRFGLVGDPGWEEVLLGQTPGQAIQHAGLAWLDLLPAGKRLARTSTTRWATHARKVLQHLARQYRLILATTPPWHRSPYASLMSEAGDALALLVEPDELGQPMERRCLDALVGQGRPVLGTIVLQDA